MSKEEARELKLELVKNKTTLGEYMGTKQYAPRKLDIACGQNKTKGFKGIDLSGDADITHDLFKTPWPIKAGSVHEVVCNHFVEHIPYKLEDGKDGWFVFFDEVYRILKKGGTAILRHPYVWNDRAFWDPTHVRFVHEMNYWYLNKEWRTANGLDHYPVSCDFELPTVGFQYATDELAAKPDEYQMWARTHLKNAIGDLEVTITKR